MSSATAIRFIVNSTRSASGSIYLQCRVKPRASKQREGVFAITDDSVELCVNSQARDGEATKAVTKVLSEILRLPKTNVEIIKGFKSRDKTIAISFIDSDGDEAGCVTKIRELLLASIK